MRFFLCDRIVAENGAVLHAPEARQTRLLAKPPPEEFARALERRIGAPPAAGRVIAATGRPHEADVLEVIRELGLEFHVTFNRGAVMALPPDLSLREARSRLRQRIEARYAGPA